MKHAFAFLVLVALAPAAFADGTQLYKWTDAQGVIHYSDKPPAQTAPDLQTMDMPSFPTQDPAQLAAHQAELVAQAQAAQKLLQAQLDEQAQAAALAAQKAELQAQLAAAQQQQQSESQPAAEPIYVSSAFVPRAYRANLYLQHRFGSGNPHPSRALPDRPAISILQKPRGK